MTAPTTTARNASLEDLVGLLQDQQTSKWDAVIPAVKMRARDGLLVVDNADQLLTSDGVTTVDGVYRPTAVFDEQIAEKLGIPTTYLKRLRTERPDLYDANVNGWLHGVDAADPDVRSFFLRAFRSGQPETPGVARALLSDSYKRIDNLDVLTAALDGVRQAGVNVVFDGCDLTDRKMYVRIVAPEVQALAPTLLRDYRSPFRDPSIDAQRAHGGGGWNLDSGREAAAREGLGYAPGGEPIVFAGFVLSNSETGGGAFSIVPRLVVQVCKNGLTINADALRAVHLGSKLEEGVIRWSSDTSEKALSLVTAKTRDAVATFLDTDYVAAKITEIEQLSGRTIDDAPATIKEIGKKLTIDQQTQDDVLSHFIRGGQPTAGGLLNAITSVSQTVADADKAAEIEGKAFDALVLAAR